MPTAVKHTAAALLLLSLPFAYGCKKADTAADEKPVVGVQAAHPETGDITADIEGDAVLSPIAQAAIASKVTAPIKQFYVQRGSHVVAGQLLAKLEDQDLAGAALDNQGSYTAAQGAYTVATESTVPEDQTRARLDMEQAKATLDLDTSIFNARSQLLKEGAIPGRDVDTARATVGQAQAAYDIAKQKYDAMQKSSHKASLDAAQGQLESAKGKLQQAQAQLSYASLRSPIAGVVTDRPLFPGDTVAAGTPIVTVMDTSSLIAKLHLAQALVQQLQVGSEAKLTVPGMDDPVDAKVSLISPALDTGSTTIEVWLKVPNARGKLKAGTTVHATIDGRTIKQALLIPTDAVQRSAESGGKMVMVIGTDGLAHKKNVTIGITTKETTQILSGLSAGDMVITGGAYGLDEGTKVKIEAAKPDADDAAKPAPGEKE